MFSALGEMAFRLNAGLNSACQLRHRWRGVGFDLFSEVCLRDVGNSERLLALVVG